MRTSKLREILISPGVIWGVRPAFTNRLLSILLLAMLIFFFLLTLAPPTMSATDLDQQVDSISKKLTSFSNGEVLKGTVSEVYISLGLNQGIQPGNRFEIIRQGEALKVDDEIIGYEETRIAEVEVFRARDRMSICKILEKIEVPKIGDKAYQLRKKVTSLVVAQFSYNQAFNQLTKNLQDKLFTAMSNRGMQVTERDQLEKVLKEQKLGYSGLININSAKKIGNLLGAEGIMLGTVNDMGDAININARIVDLEIGKAIAAAEVELPKTPLIVQLLDTLVEDKPFVTGSRSDSQSHNKAGKSQKISTERGYTAVLKTCKKLTESVICNMLITNNEKDRKLRVFKEGSRLFDTSGNEFDASNMSLGSCEHRECEKVLISGIPTKTKVSFEGVSQEIQMVTALELKCWDRGSSKHFSFQFRDIPLAK